MKKTNVTITIFLMLLGVSMISLQAKESDEISGLPPGVTAGEGEFAARVENQEKFPQMQMQPEEIEACVEKVFEQWREKLAGNSQASEMQVNGYGLLRAPKEDVVVTKEGSVREYLEDEIRSNIEERLLAEVAIREAAKKIAAQRILKEANKSVEQSRQAANILAIAHANDIGSIKKELMCNQHTEQAGVLVEFLSSKQLNANVAEQAAINQIIAHWVTVGLRYQQLKQQQPSNWGRKIWSRAAQLTNVVAAAFTAYAALTEPLWSQATSRVVNPAYYHAYHAAKYDWNQAVAAHDVAIQACQQYNVSHHPDDLSLECYGSSLESQEAWRNVLYSQDALKSVLENNPWGVGMQEERFEQEFPLAHYNTSYGASLIQEMKQLLETVVNDADSAISTAKENLARSHPDGGASEPVHQANNKATYENVMKLIDEAALHSNSAAELIKKKKVSSSDIKSISQTFEKAANAAAAVKKALETAPREGGGGGWDWPYWSHNINNVQEAIKTAAQRSKEVRDIFHQIVRE